MSNNEVLKTLHRKRGSCKVKITFLNKFVQVITSSESINDNDILELQLRFEKYNKLFDEFDKIQLEIETLTSDDKIESEFNEREQFECDYYTLSTKITQILAEYNTPIKQENTSNTANNPSIIGSVDHSNNIKNVKLPTIQLAKFSGSYTQWLEFKDSFLSLIHSNDSLSHVNKFQYLKASLEGNAAQTIASIEVSNQNYETAWNILCERFDNNQLIIYNHLKGIFDLPQLIKPTSQILHKFIDDVSMHIRSLKNLKLPVHSWDVIIIFILNSKLDRETAKNWEEFKKDGELPTLEDFKTFLRQRANILGNLDIKTTSSKPWIPKQKSVALLANTPTCNYCKKGHMIYYCPDFLKLDIKGRHAAVTRANLCKNCLRTGHNHTVCRSGNCKQCKEQHNSLLHSSSPEVVLSTTIAHSSQTLLSTAQVVVIDDCGNQHSCRAVLDCGSQVNLISQNLCKKLNLPTKRSISIVNGIGAASQSVHGICDVIVRSKYDNYEQTINCLVLPSICEQLPCYKINIENFNINNSHELADPQFNVPGPIDLLLGSAVFWEVLLDGKIRLGKSKPIMTNTRLGWIIGGNLNVPISKGTQNKRCCFTTYSDIQNQLKRFWELESCQIDEKPVSECERHFIETTYRDSKGRFVVSIPHKEDFDSLGQSYDTAHKRFLSLERRLQSKADVKDKYVAFMREYEHLGHMTEVQSNTNDGYYLPHHCVLNEQSSTTKLRVVFDGSSRNTSGTSLNDIQLVGPTIQNDLFTILLRFRRHTYAICGDIEKMYRQINIRPEDRIYQKILWREDPTQPIKTYTLNTVTYGTASAPFLAIRTIHELGLMCKETKPDISEVILQDFYVDDMISGSDTIPKTIHLAQGVSKVLQEGCFPLRKWISNSQEILDNLVQNQAEKDTYNLAAKETSKTLGLIWAFKSDEFLYKTETIKIPHPVTKRTILSAISQIFDPLGLLSPITVCAKIFLQQLWLEKVEWDDIVPPNLTTLWTQFCNDLSNIKEFKLPRHVTVNNAKAIYLHGFADASERAYGACIYVSSTNEMESKCQLLCAKTRVAPLKPLTIPKLELCAAHLLAKLTSKVMKTVGINFETCNLWTDSTIVLSWIKTSPMLLKTFVRNRVNEIQTLTENCTWKHVTSKNNPADYLSRGTTAHNLKNLDLWWQGPRWLQQKVEEWPISEHSKPDANKLPELKKIAAAFLVEQKEPNDLFTRFSTLSKLIRVVALCYRFIKRAEKRKDSIHVANKTAFSVEELNMILNKLIKIAQQETFSAEIQLLTKNKQLKLKSSIASLSPFIDNNGFLRVGGRLQNSDLSYDCKHQILLSSKHPLTKLIFLNEHEKLLHSGPQLLLASIRDRFWVVNGRNLARKTVHNCITCFRANPTPSTQFMGNLPAHRVKRSYPFQITGTDYAGPFLIRPSKGRGIKRIKCYLCIFVCFSTKAVHLEAVTDLTTQSFFATLSRFTGRRGNPSYIYSDNGTQYVGAQNELSKFFEFLKQNSDNLTNQLALQNIKWKFIPPLSPNFGGIWESVVKSVKYHLKRVLLNRCITYEEFSTFLTGIESILNSRPLSPMSSNPNDIEPLTPAHFLIGRKLTSAAPSISSPTIQNINFHHLQHLQDEFWTRWSKEYLSELQHRRKWLNKSHTTIGTLVILKEDNLPPFKWRLGRIIDIHPGEDNLVRVVSVKTQAGVFKRSVSKICPLPINNLSD